MYYRRNLNWIHSDDPGQYRDSVYPYLHFVIGGEPLSPKAPDMIPFEFSHASQGTVRFYMNKNCVPLAEGFVSGVKARMPSALYLDNTPLDSDWGTVAELWEDMLKFANEHPNHKFLSADDPGCNHSPPRVPRLGWTAFLEVDPDSGLSEEDKFWTITLSNAKGTIPEELSPLFKSAAGRQRMLDALRLDPRPTPQDAA